MTIDCRGATVVERNLTRFLHGPWVETLNPKAVNKAPPAQIRQSNAVNGFTKPARALSRDRSGIGLHDHHFVVSATKFHQRLMRADFCYFPIL